MTGARIGQVAVIAVAVAAAILVWDATTAVAIASRAVSPRLAWLVPAVIVLGLVALAVTAWRRAGVGKPARLETAAAAALLALSIVIQIAHVVLAGGGPLGIVIASAPPAVLAVCSHALLGETKRRSARVRASKEQDAPVETARAPARSGRSPRKDSDSKARSERARDVSVQATGGEREEAAGSEKAARAPGNHGTDRAVIIERLAIEHGSVERLTGTIVGTALGLTPPTGRKVLARYKEGLLAEDRVA